MVHGVKGSAQVKQDQYDTLTLVHTEQDVILHSEKGSLYSMVGLVCRLEVLMEVVL